jgi:hypothetical protein
VRDWAAKTAAQPEPGPSTPVSERLYNSAPTRRPSFPPPPAYFESSTHLDFEIDFDEYCVAPDYDPPADMVSESQSAKMCK